MAPGRTLTRFAANPEESNQDVAGVEAPLDQDVILSADTRALIRNSRACQQDRDRSNRQDDSISCRLSQDFSLAHKNLNERVNVECVDSAITIAVCTLDSAIRKILPVLRLIDKR